MTGNTTSEPHIHNRSTFESDLQNFILAAQHNDLHSSLWRRVSEEESYRPSQNRGLNFIQSIDSENFSFLSYGGYTIELGYNAGEVYLHCHKADMFEDVVFINPFAITATPYTYMAKSPLNEPTHSLPIQVFFAEGGLYDTIANRIQSELDTMQRESCATVDILNKWRDTQRK